MSEDYEYSADHWRGVFLNAKLRMIQDREVAEAAEMLIDHLRVDTGAYSHLTASTVALVEVLRARVDARRKT